MKREWRTDKPPANTVVEVEGENDIIRVRAIWGDRNRGVLPHWESEDGSSLWHPSAFDRWRVTR